MRLPSLALAISLDEEEVPAEVSPPTTEHKVRTGGITRRTRCCLPPSTTACRAAAFWGAAVRGMLPGGPGASNGRKTLPNGQQVLPLTFHRCLPRWRQHSGEML
ncbi:hypothetical protein CLOP_g19720 [Closterium sp. NIES-67]|nr:hypothetical protein CLOP_g19720 [Closterium sp. NIES-67]